MALFTISLGNKADPTTTAALARIEQKLDAIIQKEERIMLNVAALLLAVQRETAVDLSILTLVKTMAASQADLAKQLAEAIAANDPIAIAAVQKAIDDSAIAINANADTLAAAVVENTPAVPVAPSATTADPASA